MTLELTELTPHLFVLQGRSRGRFPFSHAFLVQDSVRALIDTGCGLDLLETLRQEYSLDLIINSHCHPDHTAGNWVFADLPLFVPRQGAETHGRQEPLSRRLARPGPLAGVWRRFVTTTMGFQDKAPTDVFEEGHLFDFGRLRLQALHTPGHTKDHYCFFEPEQEILLSFDLDLTSFGPWYGHRESDLGQMRRSLQRIRDLKPRVVVPSHREVVAEGIREEIDRFEAVLDRRAETIRARLQGGATLEELLQNAPIYGRYPYEPDLFRYWEGQMIEKHLEEMAAQGRVYQEEGRYYAA